MGKENLEDSNKQDKTSSAKNNGIINLFSSVSHFNETLDSVLAQQKSFEELLNQPLKQLAESVNKALEPILEQQKRIRDTLVEIGKKTKQWKDSMKVVYDAGWWFTPSFEIATSDWEGIRKILIYVERYKKGEKRAISLLFYKIYQREKCNYLKSVVHEWHENPYFRRWSTVIDEALYSHIHKKYSVSVPALLLTAEGVAADFCKRNNLINIAKSSKGSDKIEKSLKRVSEEKRELLLSDFFIDSLFSIIKDRIFKNTKSFKYSDTRGYKYFLNRHAIMHGISSSYGTLKNSLQAFLLLDILSLL